MIRLQAIKFLLCVCGVCATTSAHAFYAEQASEDTSIELRGLWQLEGVAARNPASAWYQKTHISGVSMASRWMLDISHALAWSWEAHAVAAYTPSDLQNFSWQGAQPNAPDRSGGLQSSADRGRAVWLLDRFNVQYHHDQTLVKIGRQPVQLARTFFFAPNDFFAPFAAQTFYRSYKPGMDAIRVEQGAGAWQWMWLSVLGFQPQTSFERSTAPIMTRTSHLMRIARVTERADWGVIAGRIADEAMLGFDVQGTWMEQWGGRAEGHVRQRQGVAKSRQAHFAAGIDHRWGNSLALNAEYFYQDVNMRYIQYYRSKHYTVLSASFEWTPLLQTQALWMQQWQDHSSLWSCYASYSLDNESELTLTLSKPYGKPPAGLDVGSEFALFPQQVNVAYRKYF